MFNAEWDGSYISLPSDDNSGCFELEGSSLFSAFAAAAAATGSAFASFASSSSLSSSDNVRDFVVGDDVLSSTDFLNDFAVSSAAASLASLIASDSSAVLSRASSDVAPAPSRTGRRGAAPKSSPLFN